MSTKSYKHKDKRTHIPSKEEAGMETASPVVKEKTTTEFPLNPVVHRGQDPELFWLNKYGNDNREEILNVDIRSLYRHEHIAPEKIIEKLYSQTEITPAQLSLNALFGNALDVEEIKKVSEYYKHQDGWSNRLVQGDSLLIMTSLLEREGMAGKVQMMYFDPPYGIKYGGNWQIKLNNRDVKDGNDEALTGEPEQIKAFRDTWELGIHSYMTYLRDRLLIARELLTESGSCFVQISDENVHLVRSIMDEVFGSENFVSMISFSKTGGLGSKLLDGVLDYILFYGKNIDHPIKYRQLYLEKEYGGDGASKYSSVELPNGDRRPLTLEEKIDINKLPKNSKIFRLDNLTSQGNEPFEFEFEQRKFVAVWKTNLEGLMKLSRKKRIVASKNSLNYVRYIDDFSAFPINNYWQIGGIQSRSDPKVYVVQTAAEAIKRCILMTTDPGDLILDPTCGSGTAAFVAEQWGRRWITTDTSRIALNIAKTRLMTGKFPFYKLYDEKSADVSQGFIYKKVPHVTLKSLANDEPAEEETFFDQPETDKKRLRVSGPFTVETLQNYEPISPDELETIYQKDAGDVTKFEERIFEHMKSAGVKNGIKNEQAVFKRIETLAHPYLHAEGFYDTKKGEKKAYIHIGPKFGTVSRQAVNEAVRECRLRGDVDWLIILGFSFESDIANKTETTSAGTFEVTKVRMHDDLMQDGLLKKDKKAASFVTIGEPEVEVHKKGKTVQVEICGLDIYDPIKDEVKSRNINDIAYWMVDDDYDGSNFIVKQVFFCGGDKDEFDKWKKGLSELSKQSIKAKAEKTLKIEIDDDAFGRLYGHISHPIETKKGQKIAVRVISQFGEETTKVISI